MDRVFALPSHKFEARKSCLLRDLAWLSDKTLREFLGILFPRKMVVSNFLTISRRIVYLESYVIPNLPGNFKLPGIFFFWGFLQLLIPVKQMIDYLNFNNHYEDLLKQLPPSVKKDVWLRLTTRKNNPLSEEQVIGIHSDIEELLTKEVNRYFRKRDRQKIKIEANTASDGSSTLSRLDGFEKQLEEREALLKRKENNIKKTIEDQVAEEHKRLKDEYDALKNRLEGEYNKCMIDMKQKTYLFKHQLEEQQKSSSYDLERQ
jgi:hypothetical protein